MGSLTVRAVEAARPQERPYKLGDGQGLYLYVSPAGGKSWRANYSQAGKQKTRTYGRWPAMSLADARKAHALAREPHRGTEVEPAAAPKFRDVAKQWMRKHLPSLSNPKHRIQVEATLERFAYPAIGDKTLDAITRKDLSDAVEAVQKEDGGRLETAHRVAGRITAVFDYALDKGIIDKHPAARLTRILTPRTIKKPMASIRPEEAGDLVRAIMTYPEPVTRLGLLLAAHTFVRVGELRGMERGEFLEDGAIWLIPAPRMKARLPHVVPMSTQAQSLVKEAAALSGSELVLESPAQPGHPVSENTLLFALYRLGYRGRMTVHGFRALASTVLNEESGFSHDVIERQLAHSETDAVRAAYNRAEYLEARRRLMQWWSNWIQQRAEDR